MLSTGVIGVRLPVDKVLAGARAAAGQLSPEGGDAAASAILTTDSGPKVAAVTAAGFTVGGMAKGAGMIHPRLATMLVVITTDYPLAAGEPETFLRPAVEAHVQPDLGRRRLLHERCGHPPRERRERCRAGRRGVRRCASRGVRGPRTAGRRRRRGSDGRPRDRRHRCGHGTRGRGDRAPNRHLSARQDRGIRPRSRTGAACSLRRARPRTATASRASTRSGSRSRSAASPCSRTARRPAPSRTSLVPSAGSISSLGLGDGAAAYLASDLTYDYVRINAEYTT